MDTSHSQTQLERGSVGITVHHLISTVNLPLSGQGWPGVGKDKTTKLAFAGANNNQGGQILAVAVNPLGPNSDEN